MSSPLEAIERYRRLVSLIYREVGSMKADNHKLYTKSNFAQIPSIHIARKRQTRSFYFNSTAKDDVELIEKDYVDWSGLTLHEVFQIFQEGNWLLGAKKYSYGGPKWAEITRFALEIRSAIINEDESELSSIVDQVQHLRHNTGYIVDKFKELI